MRIGFYGIYLPQNYLAVRPYQLEYTIGKVPVLVFFYQQVTIQPLHP